MPRPRAQCLTEMGAQPIEWCHDSFTCRVYRVARHRLGTRCATGRAERPRDPDRSHLRSLHANNARMRRRTREGRPHAVHARLRLGESRVRRAEHRLDGVRERLRREAVHGGRDASCSPQDGKLSLDDDIRKYLPEVPSFGGQKITIRNLLTHTSGLRDQWGLLGIEGRGPGTQVHSPMTTLDLVVHQKMLNFPPGSEYLYSNTGYALAGIIVERVSGKSLSEFTQRAPLPSARHDAHAVARRLHHGRAESRHGVQRHRAAGYHTRTCRSRT